MKKKLFSIWEFLVFFLTVAFVVTCCLLLFITGTDLPPDFLRQRAILTFLNVILLSLIFTAIDRVRRKITMELPIRRILKATNRITTGDFSVRIPPMNRLGGLSELDKITENFNEMAKELEGIEMLRTDFIANVSHELKTPLAVIQNYASLLRSSGLSEETRQEYAKSIMDATRRLSDLITNILRLNKLENQSIAPEREVYDLSEQLCECLIGFEELLDDKSLTLHAELPERIKVNADRELLSLVWNNLLSNAVKFTPEGGAISVTLTQDKEQTQVCIADTGCGISREVGEHIFEKFYQGDTAHSAQGNGLGLPLVKRVIDLMRGEISLESEVGKGSIFTVKL